jgi:hypothetical protein
MAHLGFVSRVTVSLDGKIIESGIEELIAVTRVFSGFHSPADLDFFVVIRSLLKAAGKWLQACDLEDRDQFVLRWEDFIFSESPAFVRSCPS